MAFSNLPHTPNRLNVYNTKSQKIKSLSNDDAFFEHVTTAELMQGHVEWDEKSWHCTEFSPYGVRFLYHMLPGERVTPLLTHTYLQDLGLMELCTGDFSRPIWVPITGTLNKGELKKKWYLTYCKAHGCIIV